MGDPLMAQQFPTGTRIDPEGNAIFPPGTKIGPDGQIVTSTEPTTAPQPQLPTSPLMDAGKGVLKGIASTAIGASQLVNKGLSAVGIADPIKPEVFDAARQDFATPEGAAQKIGFGAEQIGEFLIPFGGAAKAVAAVPKGVRALRGLARAGGEAAEMGTKAAVQTGGEADDVVTAALLGGASQPIVAGARAVGKVVGSALPERLYTQILPMATDDWLQAVRTQARGQAPNPTLAREVLDRGLRGNSMNMATYAVKKLDALEKQVKALVTTGMGPSGSPASTAMSTVALPKKKELIAVLKGLQQSFGKTFFSERAKEASVLASKLRTVKGDNARAVDALDAKRFLDKMRNTSSFRLDPKLTAKQEELKGAADMVRGALRQDTRFAKLMDEERIMIEALDSIVDDAVRRQNKKLIGLTDYLLGGGGMAAGWGVSGIGAAAAVRGFQQPFTLTNLGFALDRLYKATPSAERLARPAVGAASVGSR